MDCKDCDKCQEEIHTLPSNTFQVCPDCGQPAVEETHGMKLCRNCGEVV